MGVTTGQTRFQWLTVVVTLLPFIAVNVCFQVSSAAGYIPDCFVYLDGCTSISATGRHGVAYWIFKLLMLPQCVLLVMFWQALSDRLDQPARWWLRLTVTASIFLTVYVLALGSEGDLYRMMRRYGVFVFFLGTFITQISVTINHARERLPVAIVRVQGGLLVLMLMLAVAEVPLGTFGLEDDQAENIIEWNFSLLMQCWFACWWFLSRPTTAD